jgi:hypothetical protein
MALSDLRQNHPGDELMSDAPFRTVASSSPESGEGFYHGIRTAAALSVSCWIGWSAGESADDADAGGPE